MSRSNFFENTSHSSFEGSHIINTAGDHITNFVAGDITRIIGSPDQMVSNGVCGESIFNQYHDLRRCDIRLLRELSTSEIDEEETLWSDRKQTQKKLKYTRTTHSVSLFGVPGNYSHCVAMHYSGRDAHAAWERDFLRYSSQYGSRHVLIVQKSNPALVFCDDIVPLALIWEKCSSVVKCHLNVHFNLARRMFPESMGGRSFADESYTKQGAVFVRRDTGTICFGGQSRAAIASQVITRGIPWSFSAIVAEEPDKLLPFDLFHDETRTLEYLWGIPKKDSLLQQIMTSSPLDMLSHFTHFWLPEHGHNMFPITLPSISSRTASDKDSFRTVGWFKKLDRSYSFMVSPWRSTHGKEGILFEHGWTQFHYNLTNWGKSFTSVVCLPHKLGKKLVSAWLCQGMFVANATVGDILRLEQYGVTTRVEISLIPDVGTVVLHPDIIPKNIFMFIAPVTLNQCPESGSTEVSWGDHGGHHYFWSFDPDGSTQISQRVCDLIELPKYKAKIYRFTFSCTNYQFQAVQQVQKFFGYGSSTHGFAEACGLPLIEVVPYSEDTDKPHADQSIEELDNWHLVHNNLDKVSSSELESVHDDTGVQSQLEIWFPMPRLRQQMNLTVSEILSYQDLDGSELDSCSEDWSDLGSGSSKFDFPSDISIQYLEPSPWLEGYLIGNDGLSKSCRGVTSQDGTRFCWVFGLDVPDAGPPVYTDSYGVKEQLLIEFEDEDVNGNTSTPLASTRRIVHASNTERVDITEYVDSTISPLVHARYGHGQPKLAATRVQTETTQKKSSTEKK
ncbi:hypothetical protein K435DRAFT_855004 [Dendrothele bispora CBS 962.96]|uniref:Uncharacterized protein n=1 Tax=Dendrothele bispora (strain CBS 962.96) TaxID=1314807 RepID=A0A4S8MCV4_DENBC|nr:hypothetical protein K435DRAFT_855004 [Dendrothele bispora CBS 962.96]